MRVLVTGAEGFTGRYMTEALRRAGHEPFNFAADLTDSAAVNETIAASEADAIVHLAGNAFVHSDDFLTFYTVNQLGTFHLLDAAAKHLPGAFVLLASSANIYGITRGGILHENTPPDPVNHYATSKYAMELGARLWADRLHIVVARPFNYTGVGQEERFVIPKIVAHFRERKPVLELGNVDVSRDFGDVRSVVDAYVRLIEVRPDPTTVNICSGQPKTIREIIAFAARISGHELKILVNPAFKRPNEIALLAGDSSRLVSLVPEWEPIPIQQTISWMLAA